MHKIDWDKRERIESILADCILIKGEQKLLTDTEAQEFNIRLEQMYFQATELHKLAVAAQKRFENSEL